ncbi:hypothetical protein KEM52_004368 [Ascosphaera acerosa]|nr:hypothetical protein KEM52_004368 [Ascosphaera acerosa]
MVGFRYLGLACLAAVGATAADAQEVVDDLPVAGEPIQQQLRQLNVTAQAAFPNSEFGVKLVNGERLNAALSIVNNEEFDIALSLVAGQLFSLESDENVRNLSMARYETAIPAGKAQTVSYPMQTEMHPTDLRLLISALVTSADGQVATLPAYSGVVSVVEPETSIFDPQILFLYVFLGSLFAGTLYLFYTVWVVPYLPQKERKRGAANAKAADKAEPASPVADATASGSALKSEWIPAHHIARPEARKVKGSVKRNRSK